MVLRIGTSANEEIRIFITRRFLREIWPHLTAALAGQPAPMPQIITAEDNTAASFEQAFSEDNPTYPLGANPLLATEAAIVTNEENLLQLTLREGRERSFSLKLNDELLHALCVMLRAANENAGWDLTLEYTTPPTLVGSPAKALLH